MLLRHSSGMPWHVAYAGVPPGRRSRQCHPGDPIFQQLVAGRFSFLAQCAAVGDLLYGFNG